MSVTEGTVHIADICNFYVNFSVHFFSFNAPYKQKDILCGSELAIARTPAIRASKILLNIGLSFSTCLA
jgi:hypothetical protein